jgi:hypothetical protein
MTCGKCKKECDPFVIDEGIGAYEYWGFKGYDRRLVLYSACCEAEVLDTKGREMSPRDLD